MVSDSTPSGQHKNRNTKKVSSNLPVILVKSLQNAPCKATWNLQLRTCAYEVTIMGLPSCQKYHIFHQVTKNTKFWKKNQCMIGFQ